MKYNSVLTGAITALLISACASPPSEPRTHRDAMRDNVGKCVLGKGPAGCSGQ